MPFMRSPTSDDQGVHRSPPSRRTAIVGGAIAPLVAGLNYRKSNADLTVIACRKWLAVEAERRRLQHAWSNHETWLARTYGWLGLSLSERAAVPEGVKLAEIDAQLDVLEEESRALLKALPPDPATSVAAVIANLSVAGGLLFEEDRPEVRELILRAVRDLAVLCTQK